jgi:hypothetical protein
MLQSVIRFALRVSKKLRRKSTRSLSSTGSRPPVVEWIREGQVGGEFWDDDLEGVEW